MEPDCNLGPLLDLPPHIRITTPPPREDTTCADSALEVAAADNDEFAPAPLSEPGHFDEDLSNLDLGSINSSVFPMFDCQIPSLPLYTSSSMQGTHWLQDPTFLDPSLPNPTIEWVKKISPFAFPPSAPLVQSLMVSGNGANFGTAVVCSPADHQALCKESLGARLVHFIVAGLVNNLIKLEDLIHPESHSEKIHRIGLQHLHSLPAGLLVPLLDSVPEIYSQALRNRLFHAAIELNAHRVIPTLIQRGVDPNSEYLVHQRKVFPLERACHLGHVASVRALLHAGADPNLEGCAPFAYLLGDDSLYENLSTLTDHKVEIIGMLLREHANLHLDPPQRRRTTPRHHSSTQYCSEKLSDPRLIQCIIANAHKENLGVIVTQGYLAVMLQSHDTEVAFSLLKTVLGRGCTTEIRRSEEFLSVLNACLVNAAIRHNNEAVELLLVSGAQPSPLTLRRAVTAGNAGAVKKFLDCGVDANATECLTHPPQLHGGQRVIIPEPANRYFYNATPLADAIRSNSQECLQLFIERGFLSSISDSREAVQSALIAASGTANHTLVDILLGLPEFIENRATDYYVTQALKEAARNGHWDMVDKLLGAGIEPDTEVLTHAIASKSLRHVQLFFDALPHRTVLEDLLFDAVSKAADISILDSFLSGYGDPDSVFRVNDDGDRKVTLLSAAILAKNSEYVDYLLQAGVRLNVAGATVTPLSAAVEVCDHSLLDSLLARGANPWDDAALLAATESRNYTIVSTLLDAFKQRYPLARKNYGGRAIAKAVELGDLRLIRMLAEVVDLNCTYADRDDYQFDKYHSSLDAAIHAEHDLDLKLTILRILLQSGADPNDVYKGRLVYTNRTPLLRAIEQRDLPIVQELIRWGAKVGFPAKQGLRRTPLQQACELGYEEIVSYLLHPGGADVNEAPATSGGATAVQLAAITGWVGIADTLVRAGADVNAPAALFNGRTAFEGATEHGRIDMMIYLVEHGVDLVADGGEQYRRAVRFAKRNSQGAACGVAEKLYREAQGRAESLVLGLGLLDEGPAPGDGLSGLESFIDVDVDVGAVGFGEGMGV